MIMKITEINAITGEIIERDPNKEELEQSQIDETNRIKSQKDIEKQAQQKQAILDRLGLTAEEAALLLK